MTGMTRLILATVLAIGASIALNVAPAPARPLTTALSGANEVNAQGVPNQGDLDGSGTFTAKIKPARGTICYTITVADIGTVTGAHIHVGGATTTGPIVIHLAPPTDGSVSTCTTVDPDLLKAIKRNPADYYVNVHTADYPAGAVRGQLG